MLLRSSIAETLLANDARLIVCSLNADEVSFRKEFEQPNVELEKMPTVAGNWEHRLSTWRQYLLMNPSLGSTMKHKRESLRRSHPTRYFVTRALNLALGNIPMFRRLYMRTEARLFPAKEFDVVLKQCRPDLVVTGTPGFNIHDVHALRSAKRLAIPSATVMLSWDNLTSKGYMNGVPDNLLVWSQLMAEEATSLHEFNPDRIQWVGAAQFDHYHNVKQNLNHQEWRRIHGVPADAGLIVYGAINPAILPHEIEILREIIDSFKHQKYVRPPYLWIRLHPQVIRGAYSRALEPYRDLAAENVRVEEPAVQSEKLAWDLPKEDATHLANLLAGADVVATPGSTLMIDAACAGTPVVNVLFNGREKFQNEFSTRRFLNYVHHAKALETGGIAKAFSIDDFVGHCNSYFQDSSLDREKRFKLMEQQLGRFDGKAGERTANHLLQLARRPK